jgi:hypothetical protein
MAREEMERLVLHGLCCEWEQAAAQLRQSERKGFLQPLFAIRDLKGKWGTWSSERREISLSSELVSNHSWNAVREVLLHEMSHQCADQVFHAAHETDHGPSFKRACHLLRANPRATAGSPLLDRRISDGPLRDEGGIIARIRKLMALAKSVNRFEAEAAMNKAHELIRKHQVNFTTGADRDELISAFVGKPCLRHFREHYRLSGLLQDFYFVCGIWVPAYVMDKGRMGSVLEITGRIQNVKIARYVHDFVIRTIDAQWREYERGKRLNRFRKSDFAVGIIDGFRNRLKEGSKGREESEECLALVKAEDKELEKEVAYRYPRLRKIRGWAVRRDERVLRDGMKIGRNLVLHKGIEERSGTIKGLLPGKTRSC